MMRGLIALFVVVVLFLCSSNCVIAAPARDDSQVPAVICKLPPMRGHCRALLIRWRYDAAAKKCQEFKFGGCDGNANNFQSQKACMAVCAGV